ncbi:hypothetical protein [Apilactobacillus nanyangensis]|uniref:hypothetical protein n=1 Tax=Apilactobacillus nanyangensis TaxID=2799579 RepID=UPI001943677D|nr:hypothetical protein [Apilactobacillus nanyangensis]
MKTVQDLVDRLNNDYDMVCKIEKTDHGRYIEDDFSSYIHFENGQWDIRADFCILNHEAQKLVMDFVYTTNPNDWLLERKYYIAVGMYDSTSKLIYYKNGNGNELDFKLRTMMDFDEKHLQEDDIFTENEIEELKSTLSEQMAKIVDLGKVEVKDD